MLWLTTTRLLSLLRRPQTFLSHFRVDWFYYAVPTYLLNTLAFLESWRNKPPRTLTSLPVEVLAMIFGELGWEDVLNIRQVTCKRLKSVSQMREVWVEQYLRLSNSYEFTLPLHDYVDGMSGEELESATLQWERTEYRWMTKASPPRRRIFNSPCGADTIFHLVRGGRWLLISDKGGSMLAYNLDVPDGRPRTIIESGLNTDKGGVMLSHYPDSHPLSSFLIAVIYRDNRAPYAGCSIWEVGNLGGACPTATFCHSLKFPSSECGPCFSLAETHLAWSGLSCVEIYDWKRSSTLSHYKTGFRVVGFPNRLELLSESRILCLYRDSLAVYAVPDFGFTDDANWASGQILHSLRFPNSGFFASPSYSPVRVEHDGTRVMLVKPYEALYKLTIPQSIHDELTLTLITSDFNPHLKSDTIGLYRNHVEPMYQEVHRLTFRRGFVKDCHEPAHAEAYPGNSVRYSFPVLDDISCRSILALRPNNQFHVLDYAAL
ncbi:hypothetical protein EYR38_002283 [Pleurotus pulmonarius]|nr:hypothetical protein EYR38_002283 [Pleurotus pulmonarius]